MLTLRAAGGSVDFAEAEHRADWLRHPVYGDPSFDAFERTRGNPIHRGSAPFEWPVNGFFFSDPLSGHWYVFVGDYGKGYASPPSRCLLYRSTDRGCNWSSLGVVLHGDPQMFDHGGHTPDVSVVYAEHRYHMVYDWGEPDFNAEGGLAYAWAERPEGPWHRAPEPITRNSTLPKLLGRYQRTYAATLVRRSKDWLILAMMDHAPQSWALFGMTAPRPEGPYSERRLLRLVEADGFHPPLMEFFPAFTHAGFVYAPATSVARNRNFNALFRAPLEGAHDPAAWGLYQYGSLWHSADVEAEHYGIWGQTFSGFVDREGMFRVMFPSRDSHGHGTINLAQRPWNRPMRRRGFVLSGHQGPSMTLLQRAYDDFHLDATFQWRGTASLLLNYAAPLGPDAPTSDATLHPLMSTRHLALELGSNQWSLVQRDPTGQSQTLASGNLNPQPSAHLAVDLQRPRLSLTMEGQQLWSGDLHSASPNAISGVLGWRVEANTHLQVDRFRIRGRSHPARINYLFTEALLGAGEAPADWQEQDGPRFRFGLGVVSRQPRAPAKWNVMGSQLKLWAPCGPDFGMVELRLDGQTMGTIDLHADQLGESSVVWGSGRLSYGPHALVLVARSGSVPLDCLEVLGAD